MAGTVALYISSMRKGGAERVIANLAESFDQKGYRVVLVTTHRVENEYEVPVSVKRVISEPTQDALQKGRVGNFFTRFQTLRQIWKTEKPDVIVSFIGKNNMMAILTSLGLSIPVAVSVRGEPNEEYYNKALKIAAKTLFRLAKGVILQTEDCKKFFPKSVQKKAVIMKNPINPLFFREAYQGIREHTIVAVGRVDENKNHRMLIQAFAKIADAFPDHHLIIYGEGDKRDALIALTEELKLADRISLPGSISKVADAIERTELFVLSSNTEGMPNTLLEAMLMGLPVISTDCPCGGPKELIRHEKNGLLVPVGDVDTLAKAMKTVLSDEKRAKQLGQAAYKIRESYDRQTVLNAWETYLNGLGLRKD